MVGGVPGNQLRQKESVAKKLILPHYFIYSFLRIANNQRATGAQVFKLVGIQKLGGREQYRQRGGVFLRCPA